jgi:hypothetical protein
MSTPSQVASRLLTATKGVMDLGFLADVCSTPEVAGPLAQLAAVRDAAAAPTVPMAVAAAVVTAAPAARAPLTVHAASGAISFSKAPAAAAAAQPPAAVAPGQPSRKYQISKVIGAIPTLQGSSDVRNGKPNMPVSLDSGAELSMIRSDMLQSMLPALKAYGATLVPLDTPIEVVPIGPVMSQLTHMLVNCPVRIGRGLYRFDFVVVPEMPVPCLLGMDYIPKLNASFDWWRNTATIRLRADDLAPGCSLPGRQSVCFQTGRQLIPMYTKYTVHEMTGSA